MRNSLSRELNCLSGGGRIHDSTMGQPVIIAAGISEEGTEAAVEILYNPSFSLRVAPCEAPADWKKKTWKQ